MTRPVDEVQPPVATISAVRFTPTHDAEAAMVVELLYPNGGRATVQIDGPDTAAVMDRAGVGSALELVGKPWTVLRLSRPAVRAGTGAAR